MIRGVKIRSVMGLFPGYLGVCGAQGDGTCDHQSVSDRFKMGDLGHD